MQLQNYPQEQAHIPGRRTTSSGVYLGQEVAGRRMEQLQVALSTKATLEMLTRNVRTKLTHVERLEHSYLNQ